MTAMHELLFDPPCPGPGDYHAHIFRAGESAAAHPRYVPDYDAGLAEYLSVLDQQGLEWGTLVQPSFLGTDNSLLLEALSAQPDRLRGVVVVDETTPAATCADPDSWHTLGVRGVRLNLIGGKAPDLEGSPWTEFLLRMARTGWHLEVQANAEQLRELAPVIPALPCRIVIDHLGLPRNVDFDAHPLSRLIAYEHLWVKASGRYRSPLGCADAFLCALLDRGFTRVVFGSDWPHTRFEGSAEGAWDWALRPELQPGV